HGQELSRELLRNQKAAFRSRRSSAVHALGALFYALKARVVLPVGDGLDEFAEAPPFVLLFGVVRALIRPGNEFAGSQFLGKMLLALNFCLFVVKRDELLFHFLQIDTLVI